MLPLSIYQNQTTRRTTHTTTSKLSRRQFVKLAATATGLSVAPGVFAHSHKSHAVKSTAMANNSIGLQLYTLRDIMRVSVPATLKLVADVGYNELEFAGYFNHSPKEIKNILDNEGLTAPSAHIMLDRFTNNLTQVIDDALMLGHKYLVVPWLSEEQRGVGIGPYQALSEQLNIIGEACSKAGITLAYHNHDFEFEVRDGETPYDVLLTQTDPNLVTMEMDLYWVIKAGRNPIEYFKQYPGRFKLWHVKDMDNDGNFADVGTGTIDFNTIFANSKLAGVEHKFVERDQTNDRIATIEQGYKALNKLNNMHQTT